MIKLNLGCGFRKKADCINVDMYEGCQPDVKGDLANEVWPWPDSSVDQAIFEYSLEQMGENRNQLKHIVRELYRVLCHQGKVALVFAHPRHDRFAANPMCTHRLSPDFFQMLSLQNNMNQVASGQSDSCLAFEWGVDFMVTRFKYLIVPELQSDFESGRLSEADIRQRIRFENNICEAVEVDLMALKRTRE